MMINTYNSFAQNYINSRPAVQKLSANLTSPTPLSTPEALTFEFINDLGSNNSDSLSWFDGRQQASEFSQITKNENGEFTFKEIPANNENERDTYLQLMFINSQFSAFSTMSEDSFIALSESDSTGAPVMESVLKTIEPSYSQKMAAYEENLKYHTRLTPLELLEEEPEQPEPSFNLQDILAPLQELDMQTATP
ncbi:MAG: hypothetical protein HQL69_15285 [Magnetococcales bacterium]|nr:hypothetical protein [Magnetococcales bacterium]